MTKKQRRARDLAWKEAIADGRVLRVNRGQTFTSYPTRDQAAAALELLKRAGVPANVVKPPTR